MTLKAVGAGVGRTCTYALKLALGRGSDAVSDAGPIQRGSVEGVHLELPAAISLLLEYMHGNPAKGGRLATGILPLS